MPYLPVEFDALEKCQHIARATDARPGDVLFGLALTWRDTFRERRDRWGIDHLRAFFGTTDEVACRQNDRADLFWNIVADIEHAIGCRIPRQ